MRMAGQALAEDRHKFPNFKLGTVCDKLGIKPTGELHGALVDIELTMALYNRITYITKEKQ